MRPEPAYVGFCLLLLAGCQTLEPTAADPAAMTIAVAAVDDGVIRFELPGRAQDLEPAPQTPHTAWLPISDHRRSGARVRAGEPLVELGVDVLQRWIADRQVAIDLEETKLARRRAATERQLAELREQGVRLRTGIATQRARIEATRSADAEALRIAQRQLAEAERQLAEAERRLAEQRREAAAERLSGRRLRQAERAAAQAELAVAVPRLRHDLIANDRRGVERYRGLLRLHELTVDLGDPAPAPTTADDGGIAHRLQVLEEKLESERLQSSRRLRRYQWENERDAPTLTDPRIRADRDGVLITGPDAVPVGERLGPAAVFFIIDERVDSGVFRVPQRWRSLLAPWSAEHPEQGRLRIRVPALGETSFDGRITGIQTLTAEERGAGERIHLCECRFELPEGDLPLREGMHLAVEVLLPVPEGVGTLPLWAMQNLRQPSVLLADGSQRRLAGRRLGDRFLVFDGLLPGDRVRLPPGGVAIGGERRLSGTIEASEVIRIQGQPWRTRFVSLLRDGSTVAAGEVVATLIGRDEETREALLEEVEVLETEAEQSLRQQRLQTELDIARAEVALSKALIEERRQDFEAELERSTGISEVVTRSRVGLGQAELRLAAAVDERDELLAVAARATTTDRRRLAAQRAVTRAERGRHRARLQLAAAEQSRDRLAIRRAELAATKARQQRVVAEHGLSQARLQAQSQLAQARQRADRQYRRARRQRRSAEALVLRAPVAGQVYHQPNGWQPLRVGHRLRVRAPFFMPRGPERRLRLEVPARYWGRFRVGQELPVRIPSLGLDTILGQVTVIDEALRFSDEVIDEIILQLGTASIPERVFSLVVDLDPAALGDRHLVPGTLAWIEVPE